MLQALIQTNPCIQENNSVLSIISLLSLLRNDCQIHIRYNWLELVTVMNILQQMEYDF